MQSIPFLSGAVINTVLIFSESRFFFRSIFFLLFSVTLMQNGNNVYEVLKISKSRGQEEGVDAPCGFLLAESRAIYQGLEIFAFFIQLVYRTPSKAQHKGITIKISFSPLP